MTILNAYQWPTCPHHLAGGSLRCSLRPGHQFGCVYESRDVPDHHTRSEASDD